MPAVKSTLHPAARRVPGAILAALLGVIAFAAITGGRILRPQHVDWLMGGDPATNFFGWQFFRHSPLLQFPLGANPDYGMEIGSSIVFTDSLPLLALLFKPFSALLPDTFQYFGLWILICFVLQGVFAYKLLTRFTGDRWLPLLGCVFFLLAPAFLWRLHGHYALFGQWVLLAGLYLYFSERFSIARWMVLLGITALIHAYLLVMAGAIWAADVLQRCLRRQAGIGRALMYLCAGAALTVFVMWLAGYFMIRGGLTLEPNIFRMNLLSLIDPDDLWSKSLRDREQTGGDYEGFNYLGIGILVLALIAFVEMVRDPKPRVHYAVAAPLALVCAILTVFALSTHVAFGIREVLVYRLPEFLDGAVGAFRASGRMFWPVYYTIYLVVLGVLFRRFQPRVVATVCVALLCMQMADMSRAYQHFRTKFREPPAWSSPMKSPVWSEIGRHYKHLVFVLPHNVPTTYLPLTDFASRNRMTINIGYFARTSPAKELQAQQRVAQQILSNRLDPDSLYVFEDDSLWQVAMRQASAADLYGMVDGFRIVAPHFKECTDCDRLAIQRMGAEIGMPGP